MNAIEKLCGFLKEDTQITAHHFSGIQVLILSSYHLIREKKKKHHGINISRHTITFVTQNNYRKLQRIKQLNDLLKMRLSIEDTEDYFFFT